MTSLVITRGLPASGKTTFARAWLAHDPANRARVNRDDLRAMLFDAPDYGWEQEKLVTQAQRDLVRTLLKAGRDVVCDDTNLRPKYVREWRRFATAHGAEFDWIAFPIDVEEAIARDDTRGQQRVGTEVIRRMAEKYTRNGRLLPVPDEPSDQPETPEAYTPKPGTPPAILVDIDGTLALKAEERDIYDLTRVAEDLPNQAVIEAVRHAHRARLRIVFCSGREDSSRDATQRWLVNHLALAGDLLLMRAAGDRRRDSIVKRELFDAHVRDHYDIRYVLDDRDQVVAMWRSLGLSVFQVAPGDF